MFITFTCDNFLNRMKQYNNRATLFLLKGRFYLNYALRGHIFLLYFSRIPKIKPHCYRLKKITIPINISLITFVDIELSQLLTILSLNKMGFQRQWKLWSSVDLLQICRKWLASACSYITQMNVTVNYLINKTEGY